MNPSSSEKPPDQTDVWRNVLARDELETQIREARPTLQRLAEAFARADVGRHDSPDDLGVVEDFHVQRAAQVLFALARKPEVYAKTRSPEFFISYSVQQKAEVKAFVDQLPFQCFFPPKSIDYSKDWAEEIWHAVRVCLGFVPVVTHDWIGSRWGMYELGAAIALSKPVVPILVGALKVPEPVGDYQGFEVETAADLIDLKNQQPELWERILRELRRICRPDAGDTPQAH